MRVENTASRFMLQEPEIKRPDGPLGLYADFFTADSISLSHIKLNIFKGFKP